MSVDEKKLTRVGAKVICDKNNVAINGKYSLSNRTEEGSTFSDTIPIEYLSKDFCLLLNDQWVNELHIFKVPANSIPIVDMYNRNDVPSILMKIYCDDDTFTDSLSLIEFKSWHVKTMKH